MKYEKFKFFSHTADIKFKAFGKTINEVFENSALALFRVLYEGNVKEERIYKIKAKGKDLVGLMYNFLEEFLVLFDSRDFLPSKIKNFKLNEKKLKIVAEVSGDDIFKYRTSAHVKAITYSEMFVKKLKNIWVSQIIVDV